MKELWTVTPYGLNDKCEGKRWTERKEDEIVKEIFNPIKPIENQNDKEKRHRSRMVAKGNSKKTWIYETKHIRNRNNETDSRNPS